MQARDQGAVSRRRGGPRLTGTVPFLRREHLQHNRRSHEFSRQQTSDAGRPD